MTVRIDTDLPGGTRARAWVNLNAIVVEHGEIYTLACRHRVGWAELAEIVAVFTEASGGYDLPKCPNCSCCSDNCPNVSCPESCPC